MEFKSHPLSSAVFLLFLCHVSISAKVNTTVSRDHIAVWFDYSVRHYDHEADNAYTSEDLGVMLSLVNTRFSTIVIDTAPIVDFLPQNFDDGHVNNSRILIPHVAAQHNLRSKLAMAANNSSTALLSPKDFHPLNVIVSFDISKVVRTEQVTSFDVAKWMADSANKLFPGTVSTLMMYTGFSLFSSYYNVKDTAQQLKIAKEKMAGNETSPSYQLAIFMDLKDCGKFHGQLGEKAKEFAPHVDMIATLLRPSYHQMNLKPSVVHKMFVTKFEDCEKKLKKERSGIRVVPSVVWMSRKDSASNMVEFWELMSEWAEKSNRSIIMFEAFDTPHGHLIADQGWWRLKDIAEHKITADAFVEKLQDIDTKKEKSDSTSSLSNEDTSDEENDSPGSGSSAGKRARGNKDKKLQSSSLVNPLAVNSSTEPHDAVYITLVLLAVICVLLVAVVVGLAYGFTTVLQKSQYNNGNLMRKSYNNNGVGSSRHRTSTSDSFQEDGASINGSILEIRDTTPIVAVTYKK
ncbi:hypothetical protein Ocin01_09128 [Orchesella cincta]|uniref:Uncharacterized protein n=1 Tax=Orchesella cincta TaxID=48709 RepID=A0A1D2MWW7_ORCCI|nr:hypothetical protein Ocin01_09128 [Orchesella cincta]